MSGVENLKGFDYQITFFLLKILKNFKIKYTKTQFCSL